uniref:NAD-dependent epimerase/dehydratase n=1 Tax=Rhodopseudomonas palustris (strain BisA53) TaxID=316055 RepID=Q07RH0_RHOP5
MLTHHADGHSPPARVVVIGANSFVGKALVGRLGAVELLGLTRAELDLTAAGAAGRLSGLFRPTDSVVAIAAKAPCRNVDDFVVNARIIQTLVTALAAQPVAHVVNISSDAVYGDERVPLTEESAAAPGSLHGAMHLSREIALNGLGLPTAMLRPTLIYGASDPHNGYGPNQFRRKANAGQDVVLFGEGEELRDHVAVEDVAEIAARVLLRRSTGVLNLATGTVTSFRAIAERAVALSGQSVAVVGRPRSGPMPHNGYRAFDPAATFAAFPDFAYRPLDQGMSIAQATEYANG